MAFPKERNVPSGNYTEDTERLNERIEWVKKASERVNYNAFMARWAPQVYQARA
jgi:hypothetical protein